MFRSEDQFLDDVIINKAEIIERCLKRVNEGYSACGGDLKKDLNIQDSIILNIQRASEAAIDLAMHLVRINQLGIPKDARDAFSLLIHADIVSKDLGERLKKMVGFRNLAVHDYQAMDLDIVTSVIEHCLDDLNVYIKLAIQKA